MNWTSGHTVLVVGLGGGSDVVSARMLAERFERSHPEVTFVTGNTKRRTEPDWVQHAESVYTLPVGEPIERVRHGTADIDRRIPRGPLGDPFIFRLPGRAHLGEVTRGVLELGVDAIVGVDTGGDVLRAIRRGKMKRGRDAQMLMALKNTRLPLVLTVVGPGADGESTRSELDGIYTSALELAPGMNWVEKWSMSAQDIERLDALSAGIPERRTPRIIVAAARSAEDMMHVQREQYPEVPTAWLTEVLCWRIGEEFTLR